MCCKILKHTIIYCSVEKHLPTNINGYFSLNQHGYKKYPYRVLHNYTTERTFEIGFQLMRGKVALDHIVSALSLNLNITQIITKADNSKFPHLKFRQGSKDVGCCMERPTTEYGCKS